MTRAKFHSNDALAIMTDMRDELANATGEKCPIYRTDAGDHCSIALQYEGQGKRLYFWAKIGAREASWNIGRFGGSDDWLNIAPDTYTANPDTDWTGAQVGLYHFATAWTKALATLFPATQYREECTPEGIQLVIPGCEKITPETVQRARDILTALVGRSPFDPSAIDGIPLMSQAEKDCAKTWVQHHAIPLTDGRVVLDGEATA